MINEQPLFLSLALLQHKSDVISTTYLNSQPIRAGQGGSQHYLYKLSVESQDSVRQTCQCLPPRVVWVLSFDLEFGVYLLQSWVGIYTTEMAGSEKQLTSFFIEDILSIKEDKRRASNCGDVKDESSGWRTEQTTEKSLSLEIRTEESQHDITGNILRTCIYYWFFCLFPLK